MQFWLWQSRKAPWATDPSKMVWISCHWYYCSTSGSWWDSSSLDIQTYQPCKGLWNSLAVLPSSCSPEGHKSLPLVAVRSILSNVLYCFKCFLTLFFHLVLADGRIYWYKMWDEIPLHLYVRQNPVTSLYCYMSLCPTLAALRKGKKKNLKIKKWPFVCLKLLLKAPKVRSCCHWNGDDFFLFVHWEQSVQARSCLLHRDRQSQSCQCKGLPAATLPQ